MAWVEPLDLKTIFVDNLSGSPTIFLFISMLFIAGMSAFFRMTNGAFFLMYVVYALFISTTNADLLFMVILLGAPFALWAITKSVKT